MSGGYGKHAGDPEVSDRETCLRSVVVLTVSSVKLQ